MCAASFLAMTQLQAEDLDAGLVVALPQPEQLASDNAPEAPLGVAAALALGGAAGLVGAGVGIGVQAHQQDGVPIAPMSALGGNQ
jgi:hypothetical protein